jgi:hypothetical protein
MMIFVARGLAKEAAAVSEAPLDATGDEGK